MKADLIIPTYKPGEKFRKSLRRLEKPVEETEPGQRGGKPFPSKKEAGIPGKENAGIYP